MLGNRVAVSLHSPVVRIVGELRKQNSEGVWIYHGYGEKAALRFYPMHRVEQIEDNGPIPR